MIPEGTPIATLQIPGGIAELEVHPDALAAINASKAAEAAKAAVVAAPASA